MDRLVHPGESEPPGRDRVGVPAGLSKEHREWSQRVHTLEIRLLLSAVQMARHAVLRAQCGNNARQIVLGLHQYHDSRESFPPALTLDPPYPKLSWMGRLLPYVGQETVWAQTTEAFQRAR